MKGRRTPRRPSPAKEARQERGIDETGEEEIAVERGIIHVRPFYPTFITEKRSPGIWRVRCTRLAAPVQHCSGQAVAVSGW